MSELSDRDLLHEAASAMIRLKRAEYGLPGEYSRIDNETRSDEYGKALNAYQQDEPGLTRTALMYEVHREAIHLLMSGEAVRTRPTYYISTPEGRSYSQNWKCEHGYGRLDSCPGCDYVNEVH